MTAPHSDGAHSVLLAAGLAPLDTVTDGPVDRVRAHTHTHPALGGRQVVRLVPEALAPAEDAALDFLGFAAETTSEPLTLARPRGLGYPEWALVHDPDSRDTVLSLVRPIERASRMAVNRPGPAADEFAAIAADVPLHHLPAYWEQAGRAFLAADNARQAAVMFGRARESEQIYSLPVNEDTRRESFLEFAFAGALTVKALSAHAGELSQRYAPERALAEFRELAVRRTLGGLPPWTGLPKQIRTLARAAGLDPAEEERSLLAELLPVPATASAPEGFWKAARAGLVALGRSDPGIARALLDTFVSVPGYTDTGFHAWWLQLLEESGSVDLLADPGQPVPGGAAGWVSRMAAHTRGYNRPLPLGFLALVVRAADRLRTDGVPVDLAAKDRPPFYDIPADLLDLCLELGVPVTATDTGRRLALASWVENRHEEPRRDLSALRADPEWEPYLERAVTAYGEWYRQTLEDLLPFAYLHPYVDRRLGDLVEGIGRGGTAGLRERLESLRKESGGEAFRYFPHRLEQLESVDVGAALARTLRAGIIDEYSWPALEEAARELGADSANAPDIAGSASWPVYTLTTKAKAIAVGPQGRVAEHTPVLPKGAGSPRAVYADGQFLVVYSPEDTHGFKAYWSGAPDTVFSLGYDSIASEYWRHLADITAYLTPDGARMAGHRALRAGDQAAPRDHYVLGDGHTFWGAEPHTRVPYEVDPDTGSRGRASLPAFLEDLPLAEGERLLPLSSALAPLPGPVSGSPLGSVSGLAGFGVVHQDGGEAPHYRITATDGRSVTMRVGPGRRHAPTALFTAPGGERDHVLTSEDGATLHDPEHGSMWGCHTGTPCECTAKWGTPYLPPVAYWYFMRARDAAASARLRTVSAAQADALMDVAARERGHVPDGRAGYWRGSISSGYTVFRPRPSEKLPDPLARTREAAAALLGDGRGDSAHSDLVWGVTGLTCSALRLRGELHEYLAVARRAAEQADLERDDYMRFHDGRQLDLGKVALVAACPPHGGDLGGVAGPQGHLVPGGETDRDRGSPRAGAEYRRFLNNNFAEGTGLFNFPSVEAFLAGSANAFSITLGERRSYITQDALAAFVQDQVTLRRDLTLDVGLRYEWHVTPTERDRDPVREHLDPTTMQYHETALRDGIWETDEDGEAAPEEHEAGEESEEGLLRLKRPPVGAVRGPKREGDAEGDPGQGDDRRIGSLTVSDCGDDLSLRRPNAEPDVEGHDRAEGGAQVDDAGAVAEPGHAVLGEEEGGPLETAAPTWVIDPIDGTKNFMRGVPVFATLIALVAGGRALLGVVSAPAMGERWDAAAGLGARRNGQRIGVSAVAALPDAHVCHGDADRFRALPALWEAFGRLHDDVWRMRGFGDFWNHLLVAAGAADAAFERELPAWDVAALVPILTEAGGRISDVRGESVLDPAHPTRPNLVVTSNGRVHDELLARLAPALAAGTPSGADTPSA